MWQYEQVLMQLRLDEVNCLRMIVYLIIIFVVFFFATTMMYFW